MTWPDHTLAMLVAVAWPLYGWLSYRGYRDDVRTGASGARLAGYAESMAIEWLLATAVVALWVFHGRDFAALGLTMPDGPAGWGALGVAIGLSALMFLQSAWVWRRPETHARVREAVEPAAEMFPVDRHDFTGFVALSITAGVCEELLFRGLLPWYFGAALGSLGGHVVALIAFTLAHAYLGATSAMRAGAAGLVAAGLVLWSGSILPAMLLHAAVDIASGWMAYIVLRTPGAARA